MRPEELSKLIEILTISRLHKITPKIKKQLLSVINKERNHLTDTYPYRFSAEFDRAILYFFQMDKRIKNYQWCYARRRIWKGKLPLKKELQIIDCIEEYFNSRKEVVKSVLTKNPDLNKAGKGREILIEVRIKKLEKDTNININFKFLKFLKVFYIILMPVLYILWLLVQFIIFVFITTISIMMIFTSDRKWIWKIYFTPTTKNFQQFTIYELVDKQFKK